MSHTREGGGSSAGIPNEPPAYDYVGSDSDLENPTSMEQFEILDEDPGEEHKQRNIFKRASLATKKIACGLNNRVVRPIAQAMDPIYETLNYINMQYEKSILRVGNPLVVKRLLYILFVLLVVIFITRQSKTDGIHGISGGTFSSGKFYDMDKLGNTLRDYVDESFMKENLEYFSSMPHISGSTGDLTLAKYIKTYMHDCGASVIEFDEFRSFINYPDQDTKKTYVKLSDGLISAKLKEGDLSDLEYLSYSPNALNTNEELDAPFVFANYGTSEDLRKLEEHNINIKGHILVLKYGGAIPEANKVLLAHKNGAKAVIFITPSYTYGPEGKESVRDDVIEKINVGLSRFSAGDILTPGWSSDDLYVTRIPWFKSNSTPKIPTIPISWRDGMNFIKALGQDGVKFGENEFSGIGKNDPSHRIKLRITNKDRSTRQIWNVVGLIQGREQSEKGVIIGASRDVSCFGTMQANTGSIILIELVKIFTALQRRYNWSPSRSIYFVSFDASEYNLAGLSEWIEKRKDALSKNGYAYIDLSDAVSGDDLLIKSHPFFHSLIKSALKEVGSHLKDGNSLYDLYRSQHEGSDEISNNMIEERNYIPFINIVNIPSLEIKFTGKDFPKRSCADNFAYFEDAKIDPSMKKHKSLVELLGLILLKLSEDPIIPYDFPNLALKLLQYTDDLENYSNVALQTYDSNVKPIIKFHSMRKALQELSKTAVIFQDWGDNWRGYMRESSDLEPSVLAMNRWKINDDMVAFNSHFIIKELTKRRAGYANILFGVSFNAPDNDNSDYEWNSFPTIRDFLDKNDFGHAQNEINQLASLLAYTVRDFKQSK